MPLKGLVQAFAYTVGLSFVLGALCGWLTTYVYFVWM